MFDHVGLNVRDYAASRAFFEQALAPLGYRVVMAFDEWKAAGLGTDDKPEFWISEREPYGTGTHVAFTCSDRATVDAFHDAALDAGGIDNGAPGPGSSTTRTTTARSCTISTATTSRPSATRPNDVQFAPDGLGPADRRAARDPRPGPYARARADRSARGGDRRVARVPVGRRRALPRERHLRPLLRRAVRRPRHRNAPRA